MGCELLRFGQKSEKFLCEVLISGRPEDSDALGRARRREGRARLTTNSTWITRDTDQP